jgi:hypothetical protein
MYKFITREKEQNGTLLSLKNLLGKIPSAKIDFWIFRNLDLSNGLPLEVEYDDLLNQSEKAGGFRVSRQMMKNLIDADVQIFEGILEGYRTQQPECPVLILDCFDTSEWEISTNFPEIADEVKLRFLLVEEKIED